MSQSNTILTRRSALRAGSLSAASVLLSRAASPASAQSIHPVDRGSVSNESVNFPPIAASSEAVEQDEGPPLAPKDRVGFAVVALGRLSVEQILPAFAQSKKCKVTALVSGSGEKLKALGALYGIPADSLYNYDNFERLAQNDAVQVVYIVLPNSMHREFVLRTAAIKKQILCEKPMATSSADAQLMIDACAHAGVKLMIAYRCRYQPHHLEVIKRARDGSLGPIKIIEAINAQNQGDVNQWRLRKALVRRRLLARCRHLLPECGPRRDGGGADRDRSADPSTPNDSAVSRGRGERNLADAISVGPVMANLSTSYGIHRASLHGRQPRWRGRSWLRKCVSLQGPTAFANSGALRTSLRPKLVISGPPERSLCNRDGSHGGLRAERRDPNAR